MKRSEINRYIDEAKSFFAENHFLLPKWSEWSSAQWSSKGAECHEIIEDEPAKYHLCNEYHSL